MRTQSLALEQLPKALEPCDVLVEPSTARSGLSEKVGLLVVDQVECELVAVLGEEAARTHRISLADLEHVVTHDAHDAGAQRIRVAQSQERLTRELGADLLVALVGEAELRVIVKPTIAAAPGDVRLAEIVKEGSKPHSE